MNMMSQFAAGTALETAKVDPRLLWDVRLAEYRLLRAMSDATPDDGKRTRDGSTFLVDQRVDDYCAAMDELLDSTPAPDLEAVIIKLELIGERYQDYSLPPETLARLIEDLRLIGRPNEICRMLEKHLPPTHEKLGLEAPTPELWDAAVEAWRLAKAHAESDEDAEDIDERWSAVTARLNFVLRMPAPHIQGYLFKLEQLFGEDMNDPDNTENACYSMNWFRPFYEDAFRLLRA